MPKRAMPISEAERERQGEVLTRLREDAGLGPTKAAGLIGVSYSQLLRYEDGGTILPTSYYQAVAEAYGIRKSELSVKLGLVDEETVRDLTLKEILTAIDMPEDEQRQLLSSLGNKPTTAEERTVIIRFVAKILRKRAAGDGRDRQRA